MVSLPWLHDQDRWRACHGHMIKMDGKPVMVRVSNITHTCVWGLQFTFLYEANQSTPENFAVNVLLIEDLYE